MKVYDLFLPPLYRDFFHMIDKCQNEVEIVTNNGFHLNMKSKLGQYVVFTSILLDGEIHEFSLITHSLEDQERILRYFVGH